MLRVGLFALTLFISGVFPMGSIAEQRSAMVGIAPLEGDIEAMRQVLRHLQKAIDQRHPEDVLPLISPRILAPQRQAILDATQQFCASLPSESRYEIRTEIGRASLVPIGPERMQFHVRGTQVSGESRTAGMVHVQLESIENEGVRKWLLTSLTFPGQRTIIVGGWPWDRLAILSGIILFTVVIFVLLLRKKRRQITIE